MTNQAVLGEIPLDMIGVWCPGEIGLVTSIALPGEPLELVIDMTIYAQDTAVYSTQFEPLAGLNVVESRFPAEVIVAGLAIRGKCKCEVRGVHCGIEILFMATVAFGCRAFVLCRMTG
jgi:hypothetical protein